MFVVKKRRRLTAPTQRSQYSTGIAWHVIKRPAAGILSCSALALSLIAQQAGAFDALGVEINEQCSTQGRDPAAPYNQADLQAEDGCFLCHENGVSGGPGDGRTAFNSSPQDLDFFCILATDDDDDDDGDVGDGDDDTGDDGGDVGDGDDDTGGDVGDGDGDGDDDDNAPIGTPIRGVNSKPVLINIGNKTGTPGSTLSFEVSATDVDGNSISLVASDRPDGALFTDHGDGTGEFTWRPASDQLGTHKIIFTATDDGSPPTVEAQQISIDIVSGGANQPPVLSPIGDKTGDIQTELSFAVTATDPDGNFLTLTARGLPTGAEFTDNTNGTGQFTWTPNAGQSGTFPVTFTVTDDGQPAASDSESINLVISVANQPPVLDTIGNQVVDIGQQLEIELSATDAENDDLTFSVSAAPGDSELTDNGDGTATFSFTPDADDEGNHRLIFTVTDNGNPIGADSEDIVISAGDVNRPPELDAIGNHLVEEGQEVTFTVSASDPEGDKITLSADSLPGDAKFTDSGDNTGEFTWTPTADDIGNHSIAFTATDNGDPIETDVEEIIISVTLPGGAGNNPPVLTPIGNQIVQLGNTLNLNIIASDPDGDQLEINSSNLPVGATLTDNNNGTALLNYEPVATDVGNHYVTIAVYDDGTPVASTEQTFTISVDDGNGVNLPPELERVGFHLVTVGETLELQLKAVDPDGDNVTFQVFGLPSEAQVTNNDDGTGTLVWTPSNDDVGFNQIVIVATDDGTPVDGDAEFTFIEVEEGEVVEESELEITQARVYNQDIGRDLLSVKGVYNGNGNGTVIVRDADTGSTLGTADPNGNGTFRLQQRLDDDEIPCEITVSINSDTVTERVINGFCN